MIARTQAEEQLAAEEAGFKAYRLRAILEAKRVTESKWIVRDPSNRAITWEMDNPLFTFLYEEVI